MKWFDQPYCRSRALCGPCRTNAGVRRGLFETGQVDQIDFACPLGKEIIADPPIPPVPSRGPGTELKKILAALKVKEPGGCGCNSMARKMDAWGPDGCEKHMDEIVASMEKSAAKRGWMWLLPFKKLGAKGLVLLAIRRARGLSS